MGICKVLKNLWDGDLSRLIVSLGIEITRGLACMIWIEDKT
jgi:hypothetical protein